MTKETLLMQYQSECLSALKSVVNIHKHFEKTFMDRHRDKPEDKRFYATCCIESEPLYIKFFSLLLLSPFSLLPVLILC